jgi:hypothetical protein
MMETQFIYFNEEAKFRIVSSIFVLAIILLVILSSTGKNSSADFADLEYGKIRYYSKILGVDSPDKSGYSNGIHNYGHRFNISIDGNEVFAANSE